MIKQMRFRLWFDLLMYWTTVGIVARLFGKRRVFIIDAIATGYDHSSKALQLKSYLLIIAVLSPELKYDYYHDIFNVMGIINVAMGQGWSVETIIRNVRKEYPQPLDRKTEKE